MLRGDSTIGKNEPPWDRNSEKNKGCSARERRRKEEKMEGKKKRKKEKRKKNEKEEVSISMMQTEN